MAKDYRDKTAPPSAVLYVEKLNLPNLKRECIKRGLPFDKVGDLGIFGLQSWFLKNYNNTINPELLNQYDLWVEKFLRERGVDESLLTPALRLGTTLETGPDGAVIKKKRVRSKIPKVREKKARTEDGLYTGTKKALTFKLQKEGKTKAEVIAIVKEQYPDAKEKSIGIWYNKCRRLNKNKDGKDM